MDSTGPLELGRAAFERAAWSEAFAHLSRADGERELEVEDLERLAAAAYLLGREPDSVDGWARGFQVALARDDAAAAFRCGFWLAFALLNAGDLSRGGGWVTRAERLLPPEPLDVPERGYVLYLRALRTVLGGGEAGEAGEGQDPTAAFAAAAEIGDRFGDADLVALARLAQGRLLIRTGDPRAGTALLDEVMVAVTAGELSAVLTGDLYCTAIEGCQEVFDLRRAQEWTAALATWCGAQPQLVHYRGQCLVHRAELLQLHGAWADAGHEADRACHHLSEPTRQPALGAARYLQAELQRLRGDAVAAEDGYRRANLSGREPQPGLALLRLGQGDVGSARAAVRRALGEADDHISRARLLPTYVEVLLAAGDVAEAAAGAEELSTIARRVGAPYLAAQAAHATGAVLLGRGDAEAALAALRPAWVEWHRLDAPYQAARVRELIGLACRHLGDEDGATMELDAARWVLRQLGAGPDLARVEALLRDGPARSPGVLTDREVQVLRLVAAGKSNRAVAADLVISEKTVARHLSNIFTKLDIGSRSAATAYAYRHDLV